MKTRRSLDDLLVLAVLTTSVLCAFLPLAGCATPTHQVRQDSDPTVDLRSYKTFAFFETDEATYASLLETRLRQATRRQLESQHYVYDERSPDLRVNYALQVVERQGLKTASSAGYRGWNRSGVESYDYRQGTLIVDLVDAQRQALVWRAVAEGRLDERAIQQPGPTIDAAVGELFARFPGGSTQAR